MSAAKLPLAYRDSCAHLLIPLNRCRFDTYYLPWKCMVRTSRPSCRALRRESRERRRWTDDEAEQDERHSYEKCQYAEFQRRVKKMDELRAARDGQRSN